MNLKPITGLVVVQSARRMKAGTRVAGIEVTVVGSPTSGHSGDFTIHQLDALSRSSDRNLDICLKRTEHSSRVIITKKAVAQTRNGIANAVRSLADALEAHLGLSVITHT